MLTRPTKMLNFITGSDFLAIKDTNDSTDANNTVGLAQVKYQDQWGTICCKKWNSELTDKFCGLINSDWE